MSEPWPWPEPADDGAADHLRTGRLSLPALSLPATIGTTVDLTGWTGWSVAFIYPWTGYPGAANPPGWDDIPGAHGSTPQAAGYADAFAQFSAAGIRVFGLSNQVPAEQAAFAGRIQLPFPLLSDASGVIRSALDLPTFRAGGDEFYARLTLLCHGRDIRHVRYPVHPPPDDARLTLATALQFAENG